MPGAASGASKRRRYAIVGTGVRGIGMWGRPLVERYSDVLEFVGLCDVNPLRVEAAKQAIGVPCPTFTSLEAMLDQAKPELLMVTTVDATHEGCIVTALERGVDVLTEKPMVVDERQCQVVLDAEKRSGRKIGVTFNYRYAPKHQKIKELLLSGAIGRVTSVDFSWYLDTTHGADYFRRWHRLRRRAARSGSTRRPTTSTSSTGGSTPTRSRCRPSAACSATASRVPSTPRTAGRARTRRSARTTGTSRRTRGSSRSTWTARRPTGTSATAASSRRTSTSPTR